MPLTTKQTKEKNPTLFQAVANALKAAIRLANAGKRQAAALWTQVRKAPESIDDPVAQLNDPGFEITSRPPRIAHFTAVLNRAGVPSRPRLATGRSCSGKPPTTNRVMSRGRSPTPVDWRAAFQTRAAGSDLPARRLQITTTEPDAPARRWLYGLAGLGG